MKINRQGMVFQLTQAGGYLKDPYPHCAVVKTLVGYNSSMSE